MSSNITPPKNSKFLKPPIRIKRNKFSQNQLKIAGPAGCFSGRSVGLRGELELLRRRSFVVVDKRTGPGPIRFALRRLARRPFSSSIFILLALVATTSCSVQGSIPVQMADQAQRARQLVCLYDVLPRLPVDLGFESMLRHSSFGLSSSGRLCACRCTASASLPLSPKQTLNRKP